MRTQPQIKEIYVVLSMHLKFIHRCNNNLQLLTTLILPLYTDNISTSYKR